MGSVKQVGWVHAFGVVAGVATDIREDSVVDIKAKSMRPNKLAVDLDAAVSAFLVAGPIPTGLCDVHIGPKSLGDAIFNHVNSYSVGWPLAVRAVQGHLLSSNRSTSH